MIIHDFEKHNEIANGILRITISADGKDASSLCPSVLLEMRLVNSETVNCFLISKNVRFVSSFMIGGIRFNGSICFVLKGSNSLLMRMDPWVV